jgi:hypothetical protein
MDSFDSLGRILGPMLAGRLYGWDPSVPYLVSAGILAACCLGLAIRWTLASSARPPRR